VKDASKAARCRRDVRDDDGAADDHEHAQHVHHVQLLVEPVVRDEHVRRHRGRAAGRGDEGLAGQTQRYEVTDRARDDHAHAEPPHGHPCVRDPQVGLHGLELGVRKLLDVDTEVGDDRRDDRQDGTCSIGGTHGS
jgi:hypothetical protein